MFLPHVKHILHLTMLRIKKQLFRKFALQSYFSQPEQKTVQIRECAFVILDTSFTLPEDEEDLAETVDEKKATLPHSVPVHELLNLPSYTPRTTKSRSPKPRSTEHGRRTRIVDRPTSITQCYILYNTCNVIYIVIYTYRYGQVGNYVSTKVSFKASGFIT